MSKHIKADGTYRLLQVCSTKANFILDYDVMRWSSGALKSLVGLEIEIPSLVTIASNITIDDGARYGIVGALQRVARIDICMILGSRIESSMVTLADNLWND